MLTGTPPGDSFLLVHQLLSGYQRRPRVVMKATLQLDPSVDIVGNRLPNVLIRGRQTGERIFTEEIERLARGLNQDGALVIFPRAGTGRRTAGAGGYGGWNTWVVRTWRREPGTCRTCSRRGPAGRWRRWPPARTPT